MGTGRASWRQGQRNPIRRWENHLGKGRRQHRTRHGNDEGSGKEWVRPSSAASIIILQSGGTCRSGVWRRNYPQKACMRGRWRKRWARKGDAKDVEGRMTSHARRGRPAQHHSPSRSVMVPRLRGRQGKGQGPREEVRPGGEEDLRDCVRLCISWGRGRARDSGRPSHTRPASSHALRSCRPTQGFGSHKHGAQGLLEDIQKLGYHEGVLKCAGEPCVAERAGGAQTSQAGTHHP